MMGHEAGRRNPHLRVVVSFVENLFKCGRIPKGFKQGQAAHSPVEDMIHETSDDDSRTRRHGAV